VRGPTGQAVLVSTTADDYQSILNILIPSRALLLQTPFGDSMYLWLTDVREGALQFSPQDLPFRQVTVKYTNIDRPPNS
jgi:hypothetical protein